MPDHKNHEENYFVDLVRFWLKISGAWCRTALVKNKAATVETKCLQQLFLPALTEIMIF
jgi:hypothetical protein